MGRWAGGQQNDYDILFLQAIDVINYDFKKLFIKGYNGQTSQTRNRKNYCYIPLYFECDVWPLQLLINNPVFIIIFAVFPTNDESNIIPIQGNYFVLGSSVYPGKYLLEITSLSCLTSNFLGFDLDL